MPPLSDTISAAPSQSIPIGHEIPPPRLLATAHDLPLELMHSFCRLQLAAEFLRKETLDMFFKKRLPICKAHRIPPAESWLSCQRHPPGTFAP